MKKFFSLLVCLFFYTNVYADGEKIIDSANALQIIVQNKKIPKQLVENANAIVVFPDVHQAGLFIGGLAGDGIIVKRDKLGWTDPLLVDIKGGSLGLQIGYQNSDLVFFILNPTVTNDILSQKVTLGVDASITAWDFSENYVDMTDIKFTSDIYVFASNKGLFAGISFGGAVISTNKNQATSTTYALQRWRGVLEKLQKD